jgi:hypothetical protein
MLRRWFAPLTAQPPSGRAWAFVLFITYTYWSVLLLAIPFALDDRLTRADLPALAVVAGIGAPLLAAAGTLAALRIAPPNAGLRGPWALLAYNLTAAATSAGFLYLTATPTDTHKLYAPLLLVVLIVNALGLWWGRRDVDLWTAWGALLVAGALTVGAAWAGVRAPLDVQRTVNDVPITFTAPEGRLLNACRPVAWDAGVPKPWDAFVRVGFDGVPLHRTLDISSVNVCPLTASTIPGNPGRVIIDVPVADFEAEMHREWLDLRLITVGGMQMLVVLAVLTALLPPVALAVGGWATGAGRGG